MGGDSVSSTRRAQQGGRRGKMPHYSATWSKSFSFLRISEDFIRAVRAAVLVMKIGTWCVNIGVVVCVGVWETETERRGEDRRNMGAWSENDRSNMQIH